MKLDDLNLAVAFAAKQHSNKSNDRPFITIYLSDSFYREMISELDKHDLSHLSDLLLDSDSGFLGNRVYVVNEDHEPFSVFVEGWEGRKNAAYLLNNDTLEGEDKKFIRLKVTEQIKRNIIKLKELGML